MSVQSTLSASISIYVRTTYLVGLYSRRQNSLPSVVSLYSGHLDSLPLGVSLYFIRQNCLLYLLGLYVYLVGLYSKVRTIYFEVSACIPRCQNSPMYSTVSEQFQYLVSLYVFHNVRTLIDCHPVFQSQNDIPPCQLVFQTSQLSCLVMQLVFRMSAQSILSTSNPLSERSTSSASNFAVYGLRSSVRQHSALVSTETRQRDP